jgi:hypothetical protein
MCTVEFTISVHNFDNMVNEKLEENEDKIQCNCQLHAPDNGKITWREIRRFRHH